MCTSCFGDVGRRFVVRSVDAGMTWQQVSADPFKSCMNGITGEAETVLADGTIIRGVWGYYLPYNPELLATHEGPILHFATSGIHATSDAGQTWHRLAVAGTAYYPRAVQAADGRIFVFGHVGGDDAYGKVDQWIVMDSFRLISRDIQIANPHSPPADKLACERVTLGEPDDCKPCIARMPDGELLLTAFHQHKRDGNRVMEQMLLFRSKDGDRSWSQPDTLDLLGREPYLTVLPDGTIFITGHLLAQDVRNQWGYTCGFLHRSTDRGRTWQSIRFASEGIKPNASNHSARNVLRLADGTLLLGVDYDGGGGPYLTWRSTNNGAPWNKTQKCEPKDFQSKHGFFRWRDVAVAGHVRQDLGAGASRHQRVSHAR